MLSIDMIMFKTMMLMERLQQDEVDEVEFRYGVTTRLENGMVSSVRAQKTQEAEEALAETDVEFEKLKCMIEATINEYKQSRVA
jgi:hypothetical protein